MSATLSHTPPRPVTSRQPFPTVTVAIPHRGPGKLLRAAVDSVLAQTFSDLVCVVVFDGDPAGMDDLADVNDPRLVTYVLPENRGRYFVDQVVLEATSSPFFLIQDSDDRSDPRRLERLLAELQRSGADGCLSDALRYDIRHPERPARRHTWPELGRPAGPGFLHRASYHGLYRTETVRRLGGWFSGCRVSYDRAFLNLVVVAGGTVVNLPEPLYLYTHRPGSLTSSPETGVHSSLRRDVEGQLADLVRQAFAATRDVEPGRKAEVVRGLVLQRCTAEELQDIAREAASLAVRLHGDTSAVPPAHTSPRPPDVHAVLDRWPPKEQSWSISRIGAIELDARLGRLRPQRVLDVGSGLSTVVAARAAARYGGKVVALEHDPAYAARTRRMLVELGLADVAEVVLAPLVPRNDLHGSGPWYDGQPQGRFDFFVVDGPPRRSGGRLAAFPACLGHRSRDWEMWLLDAHRSDERSCLEAWSRHYRFSCSVEHIDDTGVAVLRRQGSAAAEEPAVIEGLGISLLAGGRPALLARTLESLAARWPRQVRTSYVCAFVNGNDSASVRVAEETGWVDRVLTYSGGVVPLGYATSLVASAVAGRDDVGCLLHLEDDWETRTLDVSALSRGVALLDDPAVGQVRLRHRADRVLTRHMVTGRPITWARNDGYLVADAHFTFNPTLVRADLVDRVLPADGEAEAQRAFLATGLLVAQLDPGVFTHIGGSQSRRESLARRRRLAPAPGDGQVTPGRRRT